MADPETWLRWLQEVTEPPRPRDAAAALEIFRETLHDALGGDRSPEADQLRSAARDFGPPQSNWGDPLVREVGERVLREAAQIGWRPALPVAWGCLELDPPDSAALEVPSGGLALVVTRGFLTFANLLAKLVVDAIPVRVEEESLAFDLEKAPVEGSGSAERLADLMLATAVLDNPLAATPWIQAGAEGRLAATLRAGAERFTLARLGCLAVRPDAPRLPWVLREGVQVSRLAPDRQGLFEADLMALQVVGRSGDRDGVAGALCLWSVEVLLLGLAMVESLRGGAEEAPGFMPARLRRLFLHEAVRRHMGEEASALLDLWGRTERVMLALWEQAEGDFRRRVALLGK